MDSANRLGLDYRALQRWKATIPIVDVHTHVRSAEYADPFFEAAQHYGVRRVLSMQALEELDGLQARYGDRIGFIAVPRWSQIALTEEFAAMWRKDLDGFRRRGALLCKFWMAPLMRQRMGLTLQHPFMQPIVRHAVDLGFNFMTHIGDPTVWWKSRYADAAVFGTKTQQFDQLFHLLETVAPRFVIGAHMGGNVEDCDFLQAVLDRFPNYYLDCSATKWITREVARQPRRVHEFFVRNQDRILFGSDCVVERQHGFDQFASRYWCHRTMWETAYRGESPIDDPDADDPPRLAGVDLPQDVLEKLYSKNAERLGLA